MITCEECKKKEVCNTCDEQVCKVHRAELKICKVVGFYDETGKFICEECHNKEG